MSEIFVPDNILHTLICISCKNYLSSFPVYIKTNGAYGALCGRCKLTEVDNFVRDEAYENMAQFLLFPCTHKANGCAEMLIPAKLEMHEKTCRYRKFDCPTKTFSNCQWQGPQLDFITHFEDNHHKLLLMVPKFELNFLRSLKEIMLCPFRSELFIIKKEVDVRTKTFTCLVQHLRLNAETAENYSYILKVESGDQKYSHKFSIKNTYTRDNITKFTEEYIKNILMDSAAMIVNVEILKDNEIEEEESVTIENDIKKDPNINWDLLGELECPICFDFMHPPIYQCITGHSICLECKSKVLECPSCREDIGNTKNFSLEKLTQVLMYPCRYHKLGCNLSAKASAIKDHEADCEFGPYECPLKEPENCTWKSNRSEIITHVVDEHNDYILKTDKITMEFDKVEAKHDCYLILFSKKLFKLCFKYEQNEFNWTLQLVGPANECNNFNYEIDIVDNNEKKRRRYWKDICTPITDHNKRFDNLANNLLIYLDQIKPLVSTNFTYRVRVLKE